MPRQVDHDARRTALALAVWQLIRTGGIEHVTLRHLADTTGWSTGAIRHYLPTREAILSFAAQHVGRRVQARLTAARPAGTPRNQLRTMLHELLPLDEERTCEAGIWLAFVAHGQATPQIADAQGVAFDGLQDELHRVMQQLHRHQLLAPGRDPAAEATALHALIDGLTLHRLMQKLTRDQVVTALDQHLERLLP
ncbi:TetR family transcriptional regulator C-terminal domain-containing protein (plasmid) [Deinococcus taeanensis]|uniref:TetR/AcrR family transcriptional regulator n=1 Tax=Deinococcus taeanensis TaxID=2737050 RepID=UPI001CDC7091|nr:TetR family transcriptional regulator C-terminal domain-containing protein [Deinococcus taeanensis]UBV44279.1 TetR family transcriptional regulator C-terminal domain-containing protein [Deinococcus taeanensis]